MIRTYRELRSLRTFEERFEYLKLGGSVGGQTFGGRRLLNQQFYSSQEWRTTRRDVIARDFGCDLGIEGYTINDQIYVHHITPISPTELVHNDYGLALSLDNLITVSFDTHQQNHYGGNNPRRLTMVERRPGDTKLW